MSFRFIIILFIGAVVLIADDHPILGVFCLLALFL
jgi:hypothetical protein